MGDDLKKVQHGDPLRIPAGAYNAFVDVALAERLREQDRERRAARSPYPLYSYTVAIRARTAQHNLPRGSIVQLQRFLASGTTAYVQDDDPMPWVSYPDSYADVRGESLGILLSDARWLAQVVWVAVGGHCWGWVDPAEVALVTPPSVFPVGVPWDRGARPYGQMSLKTGPRSLYLRGTTPHPDDDELFPVSFGGYSPRIYGAANAELDKDVALHNSVGGAFWYRDFYWPAVANQTAESGCVLEMRVSLSPELTEDGTDVVVSIPRALLRFNREGELISAYREGNRGFRIPNGTIEEDPPDEPPGDDPPEDDPPESDPPTEPDPEDPEDPGNPPACETPPTGDPSSYPNEVHAGGEAGCLWWSDGSEWHLVLNDHWYCTGAEVNASDATCALGETIAAGDYVWSGPHATEEDCLDDCGDWWYCYYDPADPCQHGCYQPGDEPAGWEIMGDKHSTEAECAEDCFVWACYWDDAESPTDWGCYPVGEQPEGWVRVGTACYTSSADCEAVCAPEPEPECPTDCSACSEWLHSTSFNSWCSCSAGGYEWQQSGTDCVWDHVTACGNCVISDTIYCETLTADQGPFKAGDDVWAFPVVHMFDGGATYMKEASDCPAGTYTKVSGAAGAPNSVTLSTGQL